jgi:hypothetical protein
MAKIEARVFGSKRQLLLTPEGEEELKLFQQVLGTKEHGVVEGYLKFNDTWHPYLVLASAGYERKSVKT